MVGPAGHRVPTPPAPTCGGRFAANDQTESEEATMPEIFAALTKLEDVIQAILHRLPDELRPTYEAQINDAVNQVRAAVAKGGKS